MSRKRAIDVQRDAAFSMRVGGDDHSGIMHHLSTGNALCVPSVSGMDTKVHNILSKADKAKNTILDLYRLQFMPNVQKRPTLDELNKAAEKVFEAEPQLIEGWKGNAQYFSMIRNARNASEHPDEHKEVALSDFAMWPDGKIYPPLVELKHKDTPIRLLPLVEFLDFIRNSMLEQAECALVLIRHAGLLQHNPLKEGIAEFPEEERRHKFVRFYRAINFNGVARILG